MAPANPKNKIRPQTQEEKIGIRPEYFFVYGNRVRTKILLRESFSPEDQNHVVLWVNFLPILSRSPFLLARPCARQYAPHGDQTSNWTQLLMIEEPELLLIV